MLSVVVCRHEHVKNYRFYLRAFVERIWMTYTERRDTPELIEIRNTIKALRGDGVDFIAIAKKTRRSYTLVKSVVQGKARNRFIYAALLKAVREIHLTPNQQLIKMMLDMELTNKEIARRLQTHPNRISEAIHEHPDHNPEIRRKAIAIINAQYRQFK